MKKYFYQGVLYHEKSKSYYGFLLRSECRAA